MSRSCPDLLALLGAACVALAATVLPQLDTTWQAGDGALTLSVGPAWLRARLRVGDSAPGLDDDRVQGTHAALLDMELSVQAGIRGGHRFVASVGVTLPTFVRVRPAMDAAAMTLASAPAFETRTLRSMP